MNSVTFYGSAVRKCRLECCDCGHFWIVLLQFLIPRT